MDTQAATPPTPPTAQVIGNAFVEQYYHILHHSPELVYRFYQESSVLSRPEHNGVMTSVTTTEGINDKICSFDYKNYKAEIKTADAQESFKDGVIVLVTGCLTGTDNLRMKFTQTFFLAPQDKGYFVLNDVFRYVEDSVSLESSEVIINGVHDAPLASITPDPEPVHVNDLPEVDSTTLIEEVQNFEEEPHALEDNERQLIDEEEAIIYHEPQSDDNHVLAVPESASYTAKENAPKKSYASILSSQAKKAGSWSAKVYVQTNTSRVGPTKTEESPLVPVAHDPVTEESAPSASGSVNNPESDNPPEEVEGHSIYVRNLPLSVTAAQLQEAFTKFGPIKQGGVQVRSNKDFCFGFVEFQSFSSMNNAIQASPVTIGNMEAVVEIKRMNTRVASGRERFTSGRGGFRGDNFRGRRNFVSGWGYGRNEIGSRGDFSGRGRGPSGRSGEGNQQGRGRGGRRSGSSWNPVST